MSYIFHSILFSDEYRWCRTYLLRRGGSPDPLSNISSLVSAPDEISGSLSPAETTRSRVLARLEAVYVKLWLLLRWAVSAAFTKHKDVLDAVNEIQVCR